MSQAASLAGTLLRIHGAEPFDTIGEEEPTDWEAEPVYPPDQATEQLVEALEELKRSAVALDGIGNVTDLFNDEIAALQRSIKKAARVLRKADGSG